MSKRKPRATPAGIPRSRSTFTRRQRRAFWAMDLDPNFWREHCYNPITPEDAEAAVLRAEAIFTEAMQRAAIERTSVETNIPIEELHRMEAEVQAGTVSRGFANSVVWLFKKHPKTLKKLAE